MKLPENFEEIKIIDLKNNHKDNIIVTIFNVIVMLFMFIIGFFTKGVSMFIFCHYKYIIFNVLIGVLGSIVYLLLHELTHALFIKIFEPKAKIKFGINFQMAYTSANTYFKKSHYIVITLAPLTVWALLLSIPCALVYNLYFWGIFFIQIINISGAAGDLYVTITLAKLPKDILIFDNGTNMNIYAEDILAEKIKRRKEELLKKEKAKNLKQDNKKNETSNLEKIMIPFKKKI